MYCIVQYIVAPRPTHSLADGWPTNGTPARTVWIFLPISSILDHDRCYITIESLTRVVHDRSDYPSFTPALTQPWDRMRTREQHKHTRRVSRPRHEMPMMPHPPHFPLAYLPGRDQRAYQSLVGIREIRSFCVPPLPLHSWRPDCGLKAYERGSPVLLFTYDPMPHP